MKRFLYSVLFILAANTAPAQDTSKSWQVIALPYVNSHIGKSSAVYVQYKFSHNFSVNAGLRYFHNRAELYPKYNNEKFHHRFYAPGQVNHFGLAAGLKYDIPWMNDLVHPFAYYDASFFNLDCRFQYVSEEGVNSNIPVPMYNYIYRNLYTLDHGIGIGLNASLYRNLYLQVRAGGSANMIFNLPENVYSSGFTVRPSYQYMIGLQYSF